MSRRASLLAKQEKRKPRVRFPDELVFLDNIKDNDIQACNSMLRRASVQLDLNGLDSNGLTPLHNAVLEGNLSAVKLLVAHGAAVDRQDTDTWTPLHAACANGEAEIARFLLMSGASKDIKTADGERPLDLCDARDFSVISVMLESDTARRARMLSAPDENLEDESSSGDDDDDRNDNDNNNPKSSDGNSDNDDHRSTRRGHKSASPSNKVDNSAHGLDKGINKLKMSSDDNKNKIQVNAIASSKSPSSSSPNTTRKSPAGSPSRSTARKSPTTTAKFNKSPASSPKLPTKSPAASPKLPTKSPAASPKLPTKSSNTSSPSSILRKSPGGLSRSDSSPAKTPTNTKFSTSSSASNNNNGASSNQQSAKSPKPQGHSILKKTSSALT